MDFTSVSADETGAFTARSTHIPTITSTMAATIAAADNVILTPPTQRAGRPAD